MHHSKQLQRADLTQFIQNKASTPVKDKIQETKIIDKPEQMSYNMYVSPGAIGFDWMAAVMVACPGSLLGQVKNADEH
jgi:hypothetical protein